MKNNTNYNNLLNNKDSVTLNPDFITGLVDAEGCFFVYIAKRDKTKFK